jgi:hypothetical protein
MTKILDFKAAHDKRHKRVRPSPKPINTVDIANSAARIKITLERINTLFKEIRAHNIPIDSIKRNPQVLPKDADKENK